MFEGLTEIALAGWTYVQLVAHEIYVYLTTILQSALNRITSLEPTQKVVLWISALRRLADDCLDYFPIRVASATQ